MPRTSQKRKLLQQDLNDTDFLVLDVETTGLSPDAGDRVCEIGILKLRGGAIVDTFSSLIDPQRPISEGAYAVNRISPAMLAGAPEFSEVAEKVLAMAEGSVLVAYNAPFDTSFLASELRLAGYRALPNPVVDALKLARQILPGLGRYPQGNVARVIGIPMPVQHRALEDAMVTAHLFIIFTTILKAHGIQVTEGLLLGNLTQILIAKRLETLQGAIAGGGDLSIKYLSAADAEITDRIVTPRELVHPSSPLNQYPYLFAYCHSVKGERIFRIEHILDVRGAARSV